MAVEINQALGAGDARRVVELLGTIARHRGMTQVAKDSGLARESLYRSLGADGNPEFATVLKVLSSLGLTLTATWAPSDPQQGPCFGPGAGVLFDAA